MDPIFDLPADLTPHREAARGTVPATVITEWPAGTFVENLAVLADGSIVVSIHTSNAVERVTPDGARSPLATLPAPPAGLVARRGGGFYVAGGVPGVAPGRVWRVEADGRSELAAALPDALFLNGLTPLDDNTLLAAESLRGCIYRIDVRRGAAAIWFSHPLLGKITDFAFMPGANGIKVFAGHVYVTSTDRALFGRVTIRDDGSAGEWETLGESLRGDDLAFDVEGAAYLATHVENTVERVSPHGERTAIAGPAEGMPGSTAVAFGRGDADRTHLYVTTTGGLVRPYRREVQAAKLVRLETGVPGASIPLVD